MMVALAMPSAARHAYLLADAYNDAMGESESWSPWNLHGYWLSEKQR